LSASRVWEITCLGAAGKKKKTLCDKGKGGAFPLHVKRKKMKPWWLPSATVTKLLYADGPPTWVECQPKTDPPGGANELGRGLHPPDGYTRLPMGASRWWKP